MRAYCHNAQHQYLHLFSGLGLFEYLNFCEDLGMQPIMAVWAGMNYITALQVILSILVLVQVMLLVEQVSLKTSLFPTYSKLSIRYSLDSYSFPESDIGVD